MLYLSKIPGLGLSFFPTAQTFFVEEITSDGTVLGANQKIEKESPPTSKFAHFILQKSDWTTISAELAIAKALHITPKRLSHAGAKDRNATTTQLCSAFALEPSRLLSLHVKDLQINGAWGSGNPVRMGDLQGNRFTIIIPQAKEKVEAVSEIYEDLKGAFPNYFGSQRFGSMRENTHEIGKLVMQGNFEEAVMSYLCDAKGETNESAVAARKELASTQDFASALNNFPRHLKYEKLMLHHLSTNPSDFLGAFQRLPRSLSLLFLHAYQSHLFNLMLDSRILSQDFTAHEGEYYCATNPFGFPDIELGQGNIKSKSSYLVCRLLGYETKKEDLSEIEKEILEKEEISLSNFKIPKFLGLSVKGTFRCALCPLKDFSFENETGTFRFCLQKGSYATVALREFLDKNKN